MEIGIAAVVVGDVHVEIDLQRFAVVRNRAVEIALERVGAAAIVVGARVGRIEPDRLVEIGERRVERALLVVLVAADAVGGCQPAARFAL